MLKALDILYLFWQKQQLGRYVREKEMLVNKHTVIRGLDSETWAKLRDTLLAHKVITQNDKGHYLLSRDLHGIPFWQLKEWVGDERPLERTDVATGLDWQQRAHRLLQEQRRSQREILDLSLAELFDS